VGISPPHSQLLVIGEEGANKVCPYEWILCCGSLLCWDYAATICCNSVILWGSCTYQAYEAAAQQNQPNKLNGSTLASLRGDHSRCVTKKLLLPPILILGISQYITWHFGAPLVRYVTNIQVTNPALSGNECASFQGTTLSRNCCVIYSGFYKDLYVAQPFQLQIMRLWAR